MGPEFPGVELYDSSGNGVQWSQGKWLPAGGEAGAKRVCQQLEGGFIGSLPHVKKRASMEAAAEAGMSVAKNALKWLAIAMAFFVVVGLLTMTADKPPEDMPPAKSAPQPAP